MTGRKRTWFPPPPPKENPRWSHKGAQFLFNESYFSTEGIKNLQGLLRICKWVTNTHPTLPSLNNHCTFSLTLSLVQTPASQIGWSRKVSSKQRRMQLCKRDMPSERQLHLKKGKVWMTSLGHEQPSTWSLPVCQSINGYRWVQNARHDTATNRLMSDYPKNSVQMTFIFFFSRPCQAQHNHHCYEVGCKTK